MLELEVLALETVTVLGSELVTLFELVVVPVAEERPVTTPAAVTVRPSDPAPSQTAQEAHYAARPSDPRPALHSASGPAAAATRPAWVF